MIGFLDVQRIVRTAISILAFFFLSMPVAAMSVNAQVKDAGAGIAVSISPEKPPVADVLHALGNGMQAEVIFVIQIYRKPKGIVRLFGDQLVQQVRITRDARWDIYSQRYVISGTDRPIVYSDDVADFVKLFFDLKNFVLPWSFLGNGSVSKGDQPPYLMVRVQVRPMKLVPALAILSVLRMEQEIASGWLRLELPSRQNTGQ